MKDPKENEKAKLRVRLTPETAQRLLDRSNLNRNREQDLLIYKLRDKQDLSDPGADVIKDVFDVIKRGRADLFEIYSLHGFPANAQCQRTGFTPLHMAATSRAKKVIARLMQKDDIDYLLRDNQGRLASELAFIYGNDPELSESIALKEVAQGDARGIKVTRRPA